MNRPKMLQGRKNRKKSSSAIFVLFSSLRQKRISLGEEMNIENISIHFLPLSAREKKEAIYLWSSERQRPLSLPLFANLHRAASQENGPKRGRFKIVFATIIYTCGKRKREREAHFLKAAILSSRHIFSLLVFPCHD